MYGRAATSSKSLTPQARRPSESRQQPKFSTCRSPTAATTGRVGQAGRGVLGEPGEPEVVRRAEERERRTRPSARASAPDRRRGPRSARVLSQRLVALGRLDDVHGAAGAAGGAASPAGRVRSSNATPAGQSPIVISAASRIAPPCAEEITCCCRPSVTTPAGSPSCAVATSAVGQLLPRDEPRPGGEPRRSRR